MKNRFALFILVAAAPVVTAAQAKCSSPATVSISDVRVTRAGDTLRSDRVIDGKALKDGKPLQFAEVRLYSGGKIVQRSGTDEQGRFLLENLSEGRYRLWFKGMGVFTIEVTPTHMTQQAQYGFSSDHGCLGWGADTN
jgi:hypothetical protein